ncbi:hypothetical protein [Cyclobacterium amurskyense]|uniref:Uncharacterized protein n=1 Tax=Cyclobacterium amurskyense TaxID=320787 RepID=A0A0H4P677_9BACT|nr:hypothetical protein [Cyclobacterium amurskyense]AKP49614.1 hypothetical protein CA2015_0130 [Cyclobacterium amurskyense]
MKTHNPNPELWNKILERKTFDKQLEENSRKLPIREPNTEIWGQIEKRLEEPKRPVIWYYLGAAAIAMFLLFSGIDFFLSFQGDEKSPLFTEKPKLIAPDNYLAPEVINPRERIPEKIATNKFPSSEVKISPPINRKKTEPITASGMAFPPTIIKKTFTINKTTIQPPMVANKKTYHEVKITWEAEKPNSSGSPFGRKEKIQVENVNYPTATIQVKFNKSKN